MVECRMHCLNRIFIRTGCAALLGLMAWGFPASAETPPPPAFTISHASLPDAHPHHVLAENLKAQAPVQHKPDPKLGWKELEAREVAHVLDLFDFEPVAKLLYARMGDDRKRVLQHFHDMSAAASAVDGLILMFGYKKANFPSGVRVIVDLKRRDVYMTWEHGPSHKLQVRPDRSQWPPDAARTLPERE